MTEVDGIRGSGESIALQVSATVDVDPRSGGRVCSECGPHGGRGRVCLLYSWVDCTACEELEYMMAHARADDLVASHARGRRPAPGALRVDVDRLAPGRWSVRAVVRAWDVPPPGAPGVSAEGHRPGVGLTPTAIRAGLHGATYPILVP